MTGVGGGVPVLGRINNAKFKHMVKPGDTLELEAELVEVMGTAYFLKGRASVQGKTAATVEYAVTLARIEVAYGFPGVGEQDISVFGVATRRAGYFVGHVLTEQRRRCLHRPEPGEEGTVSKLFPTADIYVCDVEHEEEITRLAQDVGQKHPKIHG